MSGMRLPTWCPTSGSGSWTTGAGGTVGSGSGATAGGAWVGAGAAVAGRRRLDRRGVRRIRRTCAYGRRLGCLGFRGQRSWCGLGHHGKGRRGIRLPPVEQRPGPTGSPPAGCCSAAIFLCVLGGSCFPGDGGGIGNLGRDGLRPELKRTRPGRRLLTAWEGSPGACCSTRGWDESLCICHRVVGPAIRVG